MAHPEIDNRTPFVAEAIPHNDEDFRPVYTLLLKATYDIADNNRLILAEQQLPLNFAGEYYGDPATSSIKLEPECTLFKNTADIVLIGHAYPEAPEHLMTRVGVKVGELRKTAIVFGDRVWEKGANPQISAPQPFDKIPLCWENAFGGTDPRVEDALKISHEAHNPVGKGYADKKLPFPDLLPLPNIENPDRLIKHWLDRPEPIGFGFVAPHWLPRGQFAGTYDEQWEKTRKPLVPVDFDRRFFNAGSAGLIAPDYLKGDEEVVIVNASERGRLSFKLPELPNPLLQMKFHLSTTQTHRTELDTLIINTDDHQVSLFWRALALAPKGHLDLAEVNIKIPGVDVLAPTKQAV